MSLRLSLNVLASTLLLAACDSGADGPAQPQAEFPGDKLELTGEIDRTLAGSLMPAVNLTDPQGNTLNLGALQGQPVLLNLWATWCAPCVVEMPMLDDLADELKGKVRVVTVSQDLRGAEMVEPFFAEKGFRNLEPWLDPENELGLGYGGGSLPLTVLFDAQGQELLRVVGGYDWSSEEARAAIEEALAE
ncbi:MAG: thiol:disulfide interchange protein [Erythrobacter sp. RIFCSPHIGHO2_12_FULL_63_10]|nr:MAG: thiol:disulfide interchange protein [Erythrobacter sp. RIFCSPHIGHO2_12_FULL_63_10]